MQNSLIGSSVKINGIAKRSVPVSEVMDFLAEIDHIIYTTKNISIHAYCILHAFEYGKKSGRYSLVSDRLRTSYPKLCERLLPLHYQLSHSRKLYNHISDESARIWYGYKNKSEDKEAIKSLINLIHPDSKKDLFRFL